MPTLIRLFIVLLVLAALALGGMLALAIFVEPGQKEIRVKIPPRDLGVEISNDPLGIRTAPPPLVVAPIPTPTPAPEPAAPTDPETREVDIPE